MKHIFRLLLFLLLSTVVRADWAPPYNPNGGGTVVNGTGGGIATLGGSGTNTTLNGQTTITGTTSIQNLNGDLLNVKGFGAVGNGSTDDTTAINAAIAVLNSGTGMRLYFPPGNYITANGLAQITAAGGAVGPGKIGPPGVTTNMGATITCSSGTATCFNVTSRSFYFRDLSVVNSYSNPTASTGIMFNPSNKNDSCSYDNVTVSGFYNDIYQASGEYWTMDHCSIFGFVNYGMLIRNVQNSDYGDWCVANTTFSPDGYNGVSGLRYESSGGGKLLNCKFNQSYSTTNNMATCLDVNSTVSGSSTIILLVQNCSFENYTSRGISINAPYLPDIYINGCEFGQWAGANDTTALPIYATNTSNIIIGTNMYVGFGVVPAITFNGVSNAIVYPQLLTASYSPALSQTSDTNVSDLTSLATAFANPGITSLNDGSSVSVSLNSYWWQPQTFSLSHSGGGTVTFTPANNQANKQFYINVYTGSATTFTFPSTYTAANGTGPESLVVSGSATFGILATGTGSGIVTSSTNGF